MRLIIKFDEGSPIKRERPSAQQVLAYPFVHAFQNLSHMLSHREEAQRGRILTPEEEAAQISERALARARQPITVAEIKHRRAVQQVLAGSGEKVLSKINGLYDLMGNVHRLSEERRAGALAFGAAHASDLPEIEKELIARWRKIVEAQPLAGQYHAIHDAFSQNGRGTNERSLNFGRAIDETAQRLAIAQTAVPEDRAPKSSGRLTGFFSGLLNLSVP